MEKVISLLFDIEKKANQIIERADIEKHQLLDVNEKAIAGMEATIAEENAAKINTLTAQIEGEFEKEKKQLLEDNERQLMELEKNEGSYHEIYVKQIFHSMIQQ